MHHMPVYNEVWEKLGEAHFDRPWVYEGLLRMMYVEDGMSMNAISKEFNCSDMTVKKALEDHGIETRSMKQQLHKTESMQHGYMYKPEPDTEYEYVQTEVDGECKTVYVHQLVAIANGADPEKVYSDGDYAVHHKNKHGRDNRASNLEVKEFTNHMLDHTERLTPAEVYDAVPDDWRGDSNNDTNTNED